MQNRLICTRDFIRGGKTAPFAHVTFLFERHPKSWIELTQGMGAEAATLYVK